MYHLGFVSNGEYSKNNYIEALKKKPTFNISDIPSEKAVEASRALDALIIHSDSTADVGNVCELLIEIRKQTNALIWILSDELPNTTRIIFLQLGADGILTPNFEIEENLLILKNALIRQKSCLNASYDMYKGDEEMEGLRLVPSNLSVVIEGNKEINLTRLEFKTMEILYEKKSEAIPYQSIYQQVWRNRKEDANSNYRVANLIFHLRKKIEDNPLDPRYIKTIRSKGYMLSI